MWSMDKADGGTAPCEKKKELLQQVSCYDSLSLLLITYLPRCVQGHLQQASIHRLKQVRRSVFRPGDMGMEPPGPQRDRQTDRRFPRIGTMRALVTSQTNEARTADSGKSRVFRGSNACAAVG